MKKIAFEWYAIIEGCFLVALGFFFLQSSQLLVGGTGGLAAISNHVYEISLGTWFFLINLPFFMIAYKQMGKSFTFKSIFAIALVSTLSDTLSSLIVIDTIPLWLAAFIGGGLMGIGLLLVFRHGASLGGVNILALYLEKHYGIHTGKVIFVIDMTVLTLAFQVYSAHQVLYSVVASLVLTSVIGRYHKKAPISQQQPKPDRLKSRFKRFKLLFK
ncbi:YitT family protein [Psychrosphaera sp. F3M07]|uniref:YitT family protein n=1 Tax=Psychrosphaera sp. F3M07 TaxID=2841560 RepID=UPI001C080BA5|nr:YitT family protein [Psychrosphaera sp. F3M07]MBU2916969.1 YitT family protein [Psychrosphaera sp. F3M07]